MHIYSSDFAILHIFNLEWKNSCGQKCIKCSFIKEFEFYDIGTTDYDTCNMKLRNTVLITINLYTILLHSCL